MTRAGQSARAAGVLLLVTLLASLTQAAEIDRSTLLTREAAREWQAVGRVNIAGARDRSQCTGTLIAPDIVLTAAHCLLHPGTGQPWPSGNVHFVAGWYSGHMAGHSRAAALAVHPDFRPDAAKQAWIGADIGLIRLRDPLPADVAPFGLAIPPLPGTPVALVSYRRDRAHAPSLQEDCRYRAQDALLMLLDCPVTFGASGAPVLAEIDGERRVVGPQRDVRRRPRLCRADRRGGGKAAGNAALNRHFPLLTAIFPLSIFVASEAKKAPAFPARPARGAIIARIAHTEDQDA